MLKPKVKKKKKKEFNLAHHPCPNGIAKTISKIPSIIPKYLSKKL
jgi:hypothetical protein